MFYDESTTDTETIIKIAAKKVFMKRGFAGTRLQEIADEAKIGRTALHYYFRNKEKLFTAVLQDFFKDMVSRMPNFDNTEIPIGERMRAFVTNYMDTAIQSPEIDLFMLNEYNENPDLFIQLKESFSNDPGEAMLKAIQRAVDNGEIVGDARQIFITITSVCIFPFAAMSMLKGIMGLSKEDFVELMKARKTHLLHIIDTLFKP